MIKDVGSKAKQGLLWTTFFHFVQYAGQFGSNIILARLLFPSDFGLMGLAAIVIQFARRLTSFGFTLVLVQRKDVKNEHYDTIFWVNILLMSSLTASLITLAPYLADFFHNQNLKLIIIVISFDFIIKGVTGVPQSILERNMMFKEIGVAHTVNKYATIIATIILAFLGFGVWSLVFGNLFASVCYSVGVAYYARWFPKLRFRLWALKDCFSFGMWIYFSSFVNYGIDKIDYFLIGKFLNATQLGFYERAFELMSLPRKRIVDQVNGILFSAYSRVQDDDSKIVKGLLRVITYLGVIAYPLMIWLFFVAPSFITILYGQKWTSTIYPLQIMCITGLIESFTLLFVPMLIAKGLVGHRTRRQFVYLIILGISIFIGLRNGIVGVAWGVTAASVVHLALILHLTIQHLPFTFWSFLKAQRSVMVYSLIQILGLVLFQWLMRSYFTTDSIQMLISVTGLSAILFIGAHSIIRFKDIDDIIQEFLSELIKFLGKLPILNRLSFFASRA